MGVGVCVCVCVRAGVTCIILSLLLTLFLVSLVCGFQDGGHLCRDVELNLFGAQGLRLLKHIRCLENRGCSAVEQKRTEQNGGSQMSVPKRIEHFQAAAE